MEIGVLVYYLRKLKEKFRQELSLGDSPSLFFYSVLEDSANAFAFDTCIPSLRLLRDPHD